MKAEKLVLPIALLITLLLIPLAKAQFGTYIISDVIRSEFFHFVLVFLFFFTVSYFALKKIIFGEEPAIASLVAIIVSFFITNSFFTYFEEFLASKTVFYVALFGAFLAVMVIIRLLMKIGGLSLTWLSGLYIIFFCILQYTKLIPFKYRSALISGNVARFLWIIAVFAVLIIVFNAFNRWRKRRKEIKGEAKKEGEIERARKIARLQAEKEMKAKEGGI